MNRLSIVLVIAFVSYSLCAPENIATQNGDKNHDLEHSSEPELEKQNGYGDGNVNSDPSASDNPIDLFRPKNRNNHIVKKPVVSNGGGNRPGSREAICFAMCTIACVSGSESSTCALCMNGCPR